jgi:plasmid stabilization system protein ParE
LREVAGDVREAAAWYGVRNPQLRQAFRDALKAGVAAAQENPGRFRCVHGDFRRILLERFPYAVWFRIHLDTVVVVCVFHCARDPEELKRLLSERWVD